MTSSPFRQLLTPVVLVAALLLAAPARSADEQTAPTVDLSAEASVKAPNDFAQASLYAEASDKDPAALAATVNRMIADALAEAKSYPGIEASTAGISTYPVHSKDGQRIEAWRMRSTIQLESRDIPALSELLGRLQGTLAISNLATRPAPETRKNAADRAAVDAIRAFEARAKTVSASLGKDYRLRHLSVNYGESASPPYPMMRSAAFASQAEAAPIEGGESEISVGVSGTIELHD